MNWVGREVLVKLIIVLTSTPPGRDASPAYGLPSILVRLPEQFTHLHCTCILLGGERHCACASKVSCLRTQHNDPSASHGLDLLDLLFQSPMHKPLQCHHITQSCNKDLIFTVYVLQVFLSSSLCLSCGRGLAVSTGADAASTRGRQHAPASGFYWDWKQK